MELPYIRNDALGAALKVCATRAETGVRPGLMRAELPNCFKEG